MNLTTPLTRLLPRPVAATALALLTAAGAARGSAPGEPLDSSPPAPPPEAVTACHDKAAGDACSVSFGARTIDGTCAPESSGTLFCRPSHPPGPPPEALSACEGHSAGDACTMTGHGHTMTGTCESPPDSRALACRPSGPPPGDAR